MNDQKHTKAPIDLNLPSLPFYRLTKRASNKLEAYENEDKSIKLFTTTTAVRTALVTLSIFIIV